VIEIENNKHLGIIFQPRSGSHVLRRYMCGLLNRVDLLEWYNVYIIPPKISIKNNLMDYDENTEGPFTNKNIGTHLEEKTRLVENIKILKDLSDIKEYGVATIQSTSYVEREWLDMLELIAHQQNMQFINLDRADVLYSIISLFLSMKTMEFHNQTQYTILRNVDVKHLPLEQLHSLLQNYIDNKDAVKKYFGNISTIYYEQYQHKVSNIINLFTGIPKKIVGIGLNKFKGNHKEMISNIDEVEDYYEEFVNKHSEYFPQYFGKLPHITIPASQGRQPRILLPEYS